MSVHHFPEDFIWGTATAAYQIEGAVSTGGRSPSIWDTFTHEPGRVITGETGDIACDHYHRFREDIAIMASLGIQSYRFSISWSRVTPAVTEHALGPVNLPGLDFYRTLATEIIAAGLEPVVTLYHWDLPQSLGNSGGWENRNTSLRFAEFAALIASELGSLVPTFITLNEPWCSAYLGYYSGVHAPGKQDAVAALRAVHHLNLAHGLATSAIRAEQPTATVGLTLNLAAVQLAPGIDPQSPAAVSAVTQAENIANGVFLRPTLAGKYPDGVFAQTKDITDWSFIETGDLQLIHQPLDFLGINYYTPTVIRPLLPGETPQPHPDWIGCADIVFPEPTGPVTDMQWAIDPSGLRQLLLKMHLEYPGLPLMVTENGAAYPDGPGPQGAVADSARIDYLAGHLIAIAEVIAAGAPVRGYFLWSLLDNFEWAFGYSKRFGIVHVDFASQRRTIKNSGFWYADAIRANAVTGA